MDLHWMGFRKQFAQFKLWLNPVESPDYQAWRRRFLLDRLGLTIWLAIPSFLTIAAYQFFLLFHRFDRIQEDITLLSGGDEALATRLRLATLLSLTITGLLLTLCLRLRWSRWGERYPLHLFLLFSWSITLVDHLMGTVFGFPVMPSPLIFLAQAALIPVHWRLHLLSQVVPIAYYGLVYPLLGITRIGTRSLYDSYAVGGLVELFWFCLICNLTVFLYERLKRSEFESQRQLRVFLHSVSHDLKTPVMGASLVLKSLLKKPGAKIAVDRTVLERLLEGGDRQLGLINSLLEAYETEVQGIVLHQQPLSLASFSETVLSDLEAVLEQNQVRVKNGISSDLPLVSADGTQLWRVYNNLITNALKHNAQGVEIVLDARVQVASARTDRGLNRSWDSQGWLYCTIQDNGIGIPHEQQAHLFELYQRGARARYMPGLGLGLYLCREIITAHGGQIGVVSGEPHQGTLFWFTLPLAFSSGNLAEVG